MSVSIFLDPVGHTTKEALDQLEKGNPPFFNPWIVTLRLFTDKTIYVGLGAPDHMQGRQEVLHDRCTILIILSPSTPGHILEHLESAHWDTVFLCASVVSTSLLTIARSFVDVVDTVQLPSPWWFILFVEIFHIVDGGLTLLLVLVCWSYWYDWQGLTELLQTQYFLSLFIWRLSVYRPCLFLFYTHSLSEILLRPLLLFYLDDACTGW